MKQCNKCDTYKDLSEFPKDGRNKCKICVGLDKKISNKKWRSRNPGYYKKWMETNPNYQKKWKEANPDYHIEYKKEWKDGHPDYHPNYYQVNKKTINEQVNTRHKERYHTEPLYRLKSIIRASIGGSIKNTGYIKVSRTHKILGCTIEEFKKYIENKFESWMSWNNQGLYDGTTQFGWDLDHIIPISSAVTEEDVIRLNHYTNFQPLCGVDNRYIKKDKIPF